MSEEKHEWHEKVFSDRRAWEFDVATGLTILIVEDEHDWYHQVWAGEVKTTAQRESNELLLEQVQQRALTRAWRFLEAAMTRVEEALPRDAQSAGSSAGSSDSGEDVQSAGSSDRGEGC